MGEKYPIKWLMSDSGPSLDNRIENFLGNLAMDGKRWAHLLECARKKSFNEPFIPSVDEKDASTEVFVEEMALDEETWGRFTHYLKEYEEMRHRGNFQIENPPFPQGQSPSEPPNQPPPQIRHD